ncbi:hypothetical protein [Cellulomonas edaphi]|uniref:Uncharacterized protein n=1 Tax=Cellulomonas edaphi TaxID=3053468 RepID=A0ABT7S3J7_9CELL|nr:hypothetical protein [Cellulomons edaphi]MDM7830192.1 hypothetical protein [Cellulomons edaphi]
MSVQENDTVATTAPGNHAFTEPNPFLSETGHLTVEGRVAPMQRTVNAVPTQRAND